MCILHVSWPLLQVTVLCAFESQRNRELCHVWAEAAPQARQTHQHCLARSPGTNVSLPHLHPVSTEDSVRDFVQFVNWTEVAFCLWPSSAPKSKWCCLWLDSHSSATWRLIRSQLGSSLRTLLALFSSLFADSPCWDTASDGLFTWSGNKHCWAFRGVE